MNKEFQKTQNDQLEQKRQKQLQKEAEDARKEEQWKKDIERENKLKQRKRSTTTMRGGRKKESRSCRMCSTAGSKKKTRCGETTSNKISTGLIKGFDRY